MILTMFYRRNFRCFSQTRNIIRRTITQRTITHRNSAKPAGKGQSAKVSQPKLISKPQIIQKIQKRNHRPFGITGKPAASIRLAHQTIAWPFMVKQVIAPPTKPAKISRAASIGKCRPIKIASRASLFMLDNINNGGGKDDRAC